MSIGEDIKRMRIEKNMTQQELGQKLGGISQQQIGRWESDKANPKKETIEKIAKALDVDPYSLYSFDLANEELEKSINQNISQKGENEDKLLDNYRKLNDTGQDKAIEQVELLTKIPEYQKEPEE